MAAVEDLTSRVEDWKSLRTQQFGELMLFGTFTVLKGDGGKDQEREVSHVLPETRSFEKEVHVTQYEVVVCNDFADVSAL